MASSRPSTSKGASSKRQSSEDIGPSCSKKPKNSNQEEINEERTSSPEPQVSQDSQQSGTSTPRKKSRRKQYGEPSHQFERIMLAYLILRLTTDDDVEDFTLMSECKTYEYFDDLVLEITNTDDETREKTEKYAIQLKNAENDKCLNLKDHFDMVFEIGERNNTSRWETHKTLLKTFPETQFLMFTNRRFSKKKNYNIKFKILDELFTITKQSLANNTFNKIFRHEPQLPDDQLLVYQFINDKNNDWNNLFLYTNQMTNDKLKRDMKKILQDKFACSDEKLQEKFLVDLDGFISAWKNFEKTTEDPALKKPQMRHVIAWCLLLPHIEMWSFSEESELVNHEIFRNAVLSFDKTVLRKNLFEKIKNIWGNSKINNSDLENLDPYLIVCTEEMNCVNIFKQDKTNSEDSTKVWDDLKELERTKILWLLDKCPLAIKVSTSVSRIIDLLCRGKKFVLLDGDPKKPKTEQEENIFCNLCDLKKIYIYIYQDLARTFYCKLQGKPKITLAQLIDNDDEIDNIISTNELVQMIDQPLLIGENANKPQLYIPQSLSFAKIKLDQTFISKLSAAAIVISCEENWGHLTKQFDVLKVKDFLCENMKNKKKDQLLVSEKECSEEELNDISKKIDHSSCHYFKMKRDENSEIYLEWISSNNDISELNDFINNISYKSASDINSKINLICAHPGSGKSIFLQNIKACTQPTFWTILISPHAYFKQLDEQNFDVDSFQKHIVSYVANNAIQDEVLTGPVHGDRITSNTREKRYNTFEENLLKRFVETGRICYCWDSLDQLSGNNLNLITGIILKLHENPSTKIWIASRMSPKQEFEKRFNVIARNIKEFGPEEQKKYIEEIIKTRISSDEWDQHGKTRCDKIHQRFLNIFPSQDLSIPLHIYLLTEIYDKDAIERDGTQKLSPATLYEYFVNKKIKLCFKEAKLDFKHPIGQSILNSFRTYEIDYYEKISLKLHFDDFTEKWNAVISIRCDLQPWQTKFLSCKDAQPVVTKFIHSSFGDYFAALYLSKNREKIKDIQNFVSDDKYHNIIFFLCLILSKIQKEKDSEENNEDRDDDDFSFLFSKFNEEDSFSLLKRDKLFFKINFLSIWKQLKLVDSVEPEDTNIFDSVLYYCVRCDIEDAVDWSNRKNKKFEDEHFHVAVVFNSKKILKKLVQHEEYKEKLKTSQESLVWEASDLGHHEIVELLINIEERFSIKKGRVNELLHRAYKRGHHEIIKLLIPKINDASQLNFKDLVGETLLHYSCRDGKYEIVKLLVDCGANKYITNRHIMAPLHYVCQDKDINIANILLEGETERNNLNILDNKSKAPIHYACDSCSFNSSEKTFSIELVRLLLNKGANGNLKDKYGKMPLDYIFKYHQKEVNKDVLDLLFHNYESFVHLYMYLPKMPEVFEWWVSNKIKMDVDDKYGKLPIHYACAEGNCEMTKILINFSNHENSKNGKRPIHYACEEGHKNIVDLLVANNVDLNAKDQYGETAVHSAMYRQHYEIVELLLGVDDHRRLTVETLDTPDRYGQTLVHRACKKGKKGKLVNLLIMKNVKLDEVNKVKKTPIFYACEEGYLEIVETLIQKQVNITRKYECKKTLLHHAVERGHKEIVELLLNEDVDLNVTGNLKRMPIHEACTRGHLEILKWLLQKEAQVNVADSRGKTPLHCISKHEDHNVKKQMIIMLMEKGADLNIQINKSRKTLLHKLCEKSRKKSKSSKIERANKYQHLELIKEIIGKVDLNISDKNGQIPLHYACRFNHYEIAKLLVENMIERNIPLDIKDAEDRTPLYFAKKYRRKKIEKLFNGNDGHLLDSNIGVEPMEL